MALLKSNGSNQPVPANTGWSAPSEPDPARLRELETTIAELRAEVAELGEYRQLFEVTPRPSGYVSAAQGWRVSLLNTAGRASVAELAGVLGVAADGVVGAGADRIFGSPELNQSALASLHAPFTTTVQLRERWLELYVAPVFTQDRRRVGAVVSWTDVTGRHATSEHVTQSLQQMTKAIEEISSNAQEATQTAHEAATTAAEISDRFARLRESSAAVGDVVGVIDRVASQTQLLALNATIEAARVGEAGRGFAVVAGEVKDLARETANSTGDIRTRVQAIQAGTEEATTAVNRIVEIMSEISDRQTTIAAAVEEQTSTSTELRRVLSEVLGS